MALILLRHTRPVGAEGICYGRTDMALADGFEAEAARLAGDLPAVARIVTSPLSRCARLASALGAARGIEVETDERLIEMDFGTWEGRRWADIPRAGLDAWAADLEGANPHGGERVADLARRSRAALADWACPPGPVLAVTHAGVIKAALAIGRGPAGWSAEVGFGAWVRLGPDLREALQ